MLLGARQTLWNKFENIIPGYEVLDFVDCDTQNRGSAIYGAYTKTDINNLTRNSFELQAICIRTTACGDWNFLCGCEYSDNETGYIKLRLFGGPNTEVWEHNTGSSDNSPCPIDEIQNVHIKNRNVTINSYSWTLNSSTTVNSHYFCIGGAEIVKPNNYNARTWPGYIGRVKVLQNDVLKGDFVPVKRKSDSICGFYDLVSGNFYSSITPIPFKEAQI